MIYGHNLLVELGFRCLFSAAPWTKSKLSPNKLSPNSGKCVLKCFLLIAFAIIVIILGTSVSGASEIPATRCDELASHPEDPNRVADGIVFESIDAPDAIKACEEALAEYPENPHLLYLAGRAYLRAGEQNKAISLYTKSVNAGYAHAAYSLGLEYLDLAKAESVPTGGSLPTNSVEFKDLILQGVAFWERGVKLGSDSARLSLAELYVDGLVVKPDNDEAIRLLNPLADKGNLFALGMLARVYLDGQSPDNLTKSIEYLSRAAEGGLASAQAALGVAYHEGVGVDRDDSKAAQLYRQAADLGDADGQMYLGEAYFEGYGVDKNFDQAFYWINKSADQGLDEAIEFLNERYGKVLRLGVFFHESGMPPEDVVIPPFAENDLFGRTVKSALDWFSIQAGKSDPFALNVLGTLYWGGYFYNKDEDRGIAYLRKAADLGNDEAKLVLSKMGRLSEPE